MSGSKAPATSSGGNVGRWGVKSAPLFLRECRHVWKSSKDKDKTEGHKRLRKLLQDNPEKFMMMMSTAEQKWEYIKSRRETVKAKNSETMKDTGTEVALDLIEEWLKTHGEYLEGDDE